MADDKMLREMTCDPKFRKVLVTDGKTEVGQALVKALVKAGADMVWVGQAEPWKNLGGLDELTALRIPQSRALASLQHQLARAVDRQVVFGQGQQRLDDSGHGVPDQWV